LTFGAEVDLCAGAIWAAAGSSAALAPGQRRQDVQSIGLGDGSPTAGHLRPSSRGLRHEFGSEFVFYLRGIRKET
jgi:hypothetical protein